MAGKEEYSASEVAEALRKEEGVVRRAAQRVGCTERTIYNYRDRYVTVKRAMNEGRQRMYAKGEEKLIEALEEGKRWAIEKAVETFGESIDDGVDWADRERKEVKQDGEVTFNVKYESADGD